MLFDNEPFEEATQTIHDAAELGQVLYGGASPWATNESQVRAEATEGEILSYLRHFQTAPVQDYAVYDAPLGAIQRHSMALLTMLIFAKDEVESASGLDRGTSWQKAAKYLLPALYDAQIASALHFIKGDEQSVNATGNVDISSQFMYSIAYSAISEGERPFGDTGIIALFDDATDLGSSLDHGVNTSQTLKDSATAISKAVAEFAGKLAVGKVMGGAGNALTSGILDLALMAKSWPLTSVTAAGQMVRLMIGSWVATS